jgi:hypothetical protein
LSQPQTEKGAKLKRLAAMHWLFKVNYRPDGKLSDEEERWLVEIRKDKGFRRAQKVASRKYAKAARKGKVPVAPAEEVGA